MFTCQDATHLHTDAREGALEGWTGVWYRLHMTICPYCKRCRRQLDEAIALAKDLPPEDVPPETEENLVAAFRAHRKP
jgi:hypothetical protein